MRTAPLFALALSVAIVGCGPVGARTFQVEFPARDMRAALPVVVEDRAGIIMGIQLAPPVGDTGVIGVAGRPNELVIAWLGGRCDQRVMFNVESAPNGYTITGRTQRGEGCEQAGIFRSIALELSSPVRPERVILIAPEN